jgi:cell surface protein SprA
VRWNLAAAPAAIPGIDPNYFAQPTLEPALPDQSLAARTLRSDYRSQFSWYSIPRTIAGVTESQLSPEARLIQVQEVFPGRETNNPQDQILTTLDVYYNPTKRGQYNYNMDIKDLTENTPDLLWGGMTAVVPTGQEDLTQNNVEFLEFWVQSLLPGGRDPTAEDLLDYDGKIYIDLGIVSEDVIPNSRLNTEDGLATDLNDLIPDRATETPRSYTPSNPPPPLGQFSNVNRDLEDVGLDGMPNSNGYEGSGGRIDEQTVFAEYVDSMRVVYGEDSEEFQQIAADPSNDDYVFFTESIVGNLPLQERFYRLLGYSEGNTPVAGGERRAITNQPDTEGLQTSSILEQSDSYYQYEIDFNPADLENLRIGAPNTYIVDQILRGASAPQATRWYQIRIPLNDFKRRVGGISDFQNIRYIRLWMSGYEKPFTMRFASFEFVGSQWRKDDQITETQNSTARFEISTINIEENGNRRPFPYRQPEGSIRAENRGSQLQSLANEQSLVMEVEGLEPGALQMIERIYPGGLNLLNYSNMRMFVHGEGFDQRGDAELVMRFGIDLENNYYEYRQPVTPSDPNFPFASFDPTNTGQLNEEAQQVWLYDENSMNIVLSAFNQLKQIRNAQDAPVNDRFERSDLLEDAPPGAVIAIKGNPSLDRVSEIGMGIRNPYDPANPGSGGVPSLDAQFWVNELRVSGFDNLRGWAANAKASVKLADFATVNTNFTRQTNGFGGLDSRLGQRRQSEQLGIDVNSTINLHKLVPDRFGWNFPVSLSARQSTTTPRFLPNQGDIRLTDFEQATNARQDITEQEKDQIIRETIRNSQTRNENYSINFSNISKRNSQSKLLRYTLDNTTINYNYTQGFSRSPEIQFQDNWNFNAALRYNLTFRNVKLFRPFNFTRNIPLVRTLAGLQLGYMPSSITTSATLNRSFDEKRRRARENSDGLLIEQPLQQTHIFNHGTNLGINYNLNQLSHHGSHSQLESAGKRRCLFRPGSKAEFRPATDHRLWHSGMK